MMTAVARTLMLIEPGSTAKLATPIEAEYGLMRSHPHCEGSMRRVRGFEMQA